MKTFDDFTTYLNELQKKPKLAIIPIPAAAKVMNRTSRTIKNWIRDGKLKGISIAGENFVRASALHQIVKDREAVVLAVKNRLIEMLNEGKDRVYYADIMEEFKYNYRHSSARDEFGWILGAASRLSHNEMGALLSSMVRRKDTGFVGYGYWDLVKDLGYEEPSDDDAEKFVEKHINKCKKYYT